MNKKKIVIIIIIVAAISIGLYPLYSPLFTNKVVDEPLPIASGFEVDGYFIDNVPHQYGQLQSILS